MQSVVLAYNFIRKDRAGKLKNILDSMKIGLRWVEKEEYGEPIRVLLTRDAGQPAVSPYTGKGFTEEMLIFAHISETQLDTLLARFRSSGLSPVPYKAVLTDTNQHWNSLQCYIELKMEHAMLTEKQS